MRPTPEDVAAHFFAGHPLTPATCNRLFPQPRRRRPYPGTIPLPDPVSLLSLRDETGAIRPSRAGGWKLPD
jgi:hypothetical protein